MDLMRRRSVYGAMGLLAANVLVFIVQNIFGTSFRDAFLLNSARVWFEPYRLVTSMFLHADITHLALNMYALLIFGPIVEQRIGTKRFLLFYFIAGIFAGVVTTLFYPLALGASGAIMGILGLTIMLFPNMRVLLFFMIPMSMRTAGFVFVALEVVQMFTPSPVANAAHLAGLAAGLFYGWWLVKKGRHARKAVVSHRKLRPRKSRTGDNRSSDAIMMTEEEMDEYLKHGRL